MDRREALKWMATASSVIAAMHTNTFGADTGPDAVGSGPGTARPYGTDPDLLKGEVTWPRTMTPEQLKTTSALCDVIIPEDEKSPAASKVGVPDFIDEWISAPYDGQRHDRGVVIGGLAWLEAESAKRFGKDFASLSEEQQHAICDDICYLPKAKPEFKQGAVFFAVMRNLASSAFYTTPEGWADIGYIGNVPQAEFAGPPPEVLKHLGLTAEDLPR
ncbi:MAG: gluconate 2-dehydrogenase subunit 3 family protein [Phycisphaera sp.]|nr:gluconate 2-dehydrogenase subunit 3 family protein [Phycisphaera sp.]